MSRRAEFRRASREARQQDLADRRVEDLMPAAPGVVPSWSEPYISRAMTEAHAALPVVPGTRVEVVSYEQPVGLSLVEEAWGAEAALKIAADLRAAGPDALVIIAMRVPHAWHRTTEGAFCCDDLACPQAVTGE
jgi:hypothetical protein